MGYSNPPLRTWFYLRLTCRKFPCNRPNLVLIPLFSGRTRSVCNVSFGNYYVGETTLGPEEGFQQPWIDVLWCKHPLNVLQIGNGTAAHLINSLRPSDAYMGR